MNGKIYWYKNFVSTQNIIYKVLFNSIVILGPKKLHIEAAVFGYSNDNTPGPK